MATTTDVGKDRDRRWLILSVLVLAQFMVVLDVAIVNVALPTIKNDLHFSESGLHWVITAYAILFGGVLLLGGRMADLHAGAWSWGPTQWGCDRGGVHGARSAALTQLQHGQGATAEACMAPEARP